MTTPPIKDLAAELRLAVMRTSRILRTQASGDVVTPGQISVLALVTKRGPQSMSQLADAEHVQAPSMTRTVNSMVELGLVTREPHPEDRRQVRIAITAEGSEELNHAREQRSAWLAERLETLEDKDRETLHQAAELLIAMTQQAPRRRSTTP